MRRHLRGGAVWCAVLSSTVLQVTGQSSNVALPDLYKNVSRVVWVVKDVRAVSQAWTQLGLSDVEDRGVVQATVKYRGRAQAIPFHVVTGNLGNLGVEMIQPGESAEALSDFENRHHDGIFAIAHEAAGPSAVRSEVNRMGRNGVQVLEEVTLEGSDGPTTFTFFDTEPGGKYVLGLVVGPKWSYGAAGVVSHIALVTRQAQPVSAFWAALGFPALRIDHATPREDSRYRGKPLLLSFDVGWQKHSQFTYEWLIPPEQPPNVYADFLARHGEGVQHLGLPVPVLPAAIERFQKLGYPVWQSGAWGDIGKPHSGQYGYMDTDAVGGVVAELIHAY